MTHGRDSADQAAEQVAADLTDGLKSCRAVIDDYRAKLCGVPSAANSNEPETADRSSSG